MGASCVGGGELQGNWGDVHGAPLLSEVDPYLDDNTLFHFVKVATLVRGEKKVDSFVHETTGESNVYLTRKREILRLIHQSIYRIVQPSLFIQGT